MPVTYYDSTKRKRKLHVIVPVSLIKAAKEHGIVEKVTEDIIQSIREDLKNMFTSVECE